MKNILAVTLFLLFGALAHVSAQQTAAKPPVGVPNDAKFFNGKWYRVYLENHTWKAARRKCEEAGGQLAVVPDAQTQEFIKDLGDGLFLWLGATDEKHEGVWVWVDGTPMKFKAWAPHEPTTAKREPYLESVKKGLWNNAADNAPHIAGYICEWKR